MPTLTTISDDGQLLYLEIDFSEEDIRYIPEALNAIYKVFISDFAAYYTADKRDIDGYSSTFVLGEIKAHVEIINDSACAWIDMRITAPIPARKSIFDYVVEWCKRFVVPPDAAPNS